MIKFDKLIELINKYDYYLDNVCTTELNKNSFILIKYLIENNINLISFENGKTQGKPEKLYKKNVMFSEKNINNILIMNQKNFKLFKTLINSFLNKNNK